MAGHLVVRQRLCEARHETVHRPAADLQLYGVRGVVGIGGDRRGAQVVDWVAVAVMGVGELWPQPVDIRAAALQREVPQHVIERAVLHHQHDDVLDAWMAAVVLRPRRVWRPQDAHCRAGGSPRDH